MNTEYKEAVKNLMGAKKAYIKDKTNANFEKLASARISHSRLLSARQSRQNKAIGT